jgi:hypothetical protein
MSHKIEATKEFLNDLIGKSWQEIEALQQQIDSIDTGTYLGNEIVKLLRNTCTSYYVLIGCLEGLTDCQESRYTDVVKSEPSIKVYQRYKPDSPEKPVDAEPKAQLIAEPVINDVLDDEVIFEPKHAEAPVDFEPFEYFVDFDEPSGDPLTDDDLYCNN